MITVFITFYLFVSVKTSNDDLQVQTEKIGENVIIKCNQSIKEDKQLQSLSWFKQSYGKLPQLVVRLLGNNLKVRYGRQFQQRFNVTLKGEQFVLKIQETVKEDAGTYFCVKVKNDVTEFGSGTLLIIQDHSLHWFRLDSEEPRPGIIFTHGDSSSQCTRSSETASPTQSCVYKLPKSNLSLSDAGTYYCAVAACGETVDGDRMEGDCFGQMIILMGLSILRTAVVGGMLMIIAVIYSVKKCKN